MAFASLRFAVVNKMVQSATFTTLLKRPMAYKSAISLETLYPNSSLKLTTPAHPSDPNEKFSGYIPMDKLDISYSASSGPGGQNVNKVHTKVDLRFKPSEADWLHPDIKAKVQEMYANKLSKEGYLIIRSDATRSQQLNLADCMKKLRTILRAAAVTKKEPAPETVERIRQRHLKAARLRVAIKREDSLKRAMRQPPTIDL
ncbi:peptidyl-tRNA hydrolase ICT1, mitochondrial [Trichoplusia ni]|uniref:Large ribosomal subunit protein mL62 n=1 Tax=Trichoplusia ni TaxID=7111 RepID=A0A7E5VAW8_TRINI|nr:peptidyl-tRNA hydrolase ICT1, mitochondrial [Trichoplusia ni]